MLLNEYVDVKIGSHSIKKYKDLGYKFEKWGDTISVKVEDAPFNSRAKLLVQCDYCGEIFETTVFCYKTSIKTINKNSCNNKECKAKKAKEANMFKYGVDNTSKLLNVQEKIHNTNLKRYGIKNACQNSEVKAKRDATMLERYGTTIPLKNKEILERTHQTNIEKYGVSTPMESYELKQHYQDSIREKYGVNWISQNIEVRQKQIETCNKKYGVDNPMQSSEIKEKAIKTNIEKYGVDNVSKNPEILQRKQNTMLEKYGVIIPLKNEEILNRFKQTNLERYGVECVFQNAEIKEKIANTLYQNGNVTTSTQQMYIYNLFNQNDNLKLNYPIKFYHADMCFVEEKFVIEYDGSGHEISVKYGSMSPSEFKQKEIKRAAVLKKEGYKTMRIISHKDKLPSDKTLLSILSYARTYFSEYPHHSWCDFNIDTSQVFNTENKDGIFFDYGELRSLRQVA